jgi:hypothetical protein
VDVRELGQCVAHLVVDGALRNFAAFNMSDGNAQRNRDRRRRQHLISIGNQQQNVGPPGSQCIGQAEDREADGLGHAGVGVGAEQALDARLDRKSVALDLLQRVAKLGRQMRAKREDGEFGLGVRGEFAQRPVEMAIVRA